jgi:ubiquitin carboxyl-terminal hydrolase 4/11/15
VSKQKDPSKVISTGAYLLFYRRRSEIPLGGPRFQEIFDRYNAQHSLDDDSTLDSGEGRRLGQGSSLRGSPSALIGADLTHPRGSLGLASGRGGRDGSDAELPTYQASLDHVGEVDDDGEVRWAQGLRNSIEADGEDEAIDLPDFDNAGPSMQNITSAMGANWTFAGLKSESGPALDDDIASDVAQGDNSSVNDDPFASDGDMEPILAGSEFVESSGAHDDFSAFNDPPAPVEWDQKVHTVPASIGDDQDSEQVAEIHVGDDNEQSLSQQQQRESPDA